MMWTTTATLASLATVSGLKVAVVGGGVAGLACARRLHELGHAPTVFDTGKRAVGGRCSSRSVAVDGRRVVFDHSAQLITLGGGDAPPARGSFAALVRDGVAAGALREWPADSLAVLSRETEDAEGGATFRCARGALADDGGARFFAGRAERGGMAAVPALLADALPSDAVQRPVWVSRLAREGARWRAHHYSDDLGAFDALVVAHNGKCAARLTKGVEGLGGVHKLLRAKFAARAPASGGRELHLCSLWVLCVALRGAPAPAHGAWLEGAAVEGDPTLSWVARTDAKQGGGGGGGALSTWTLVSTREFGTANKAPQESVPRDVEDRVCGAMLDAFARALGVERGALDVAARHAQLWGAANPQNRIARASGAAASPCVLDAAARVGVCGDWLGGPVSLEGAFASGVALAERLDAADDAADAADAALLARGAKWEPVRDAPLGAIGRAPPRDDAAAAAAPTPRNAPASAPGPRRASAPRREAAPAERTLFVHLGETARGREDALRARFGGFGEVRGVQAGAKAFAFVEFADAAGAHAALAAAAAGELDAAWRVERAKADPQPKRASKPRRKRAARSPEVRTAAAAVPV